jgi:3-deoxy-D-manno-octulosonate 8-phosphate phosphatase (KDO 8-P phosphatase)
MDKFNQIKVLLLDVDGVLTDGSLYYDGKGVEIKVFNVKDGLGLRLLLQTGIQVGIITSRRSAALRERCRDLGITYIFDGVKNKAAVLDDIMALTKASAAEIAFMGDDLVDLPIMRAVGLPIAVADAHESVRQAAYLTTTAKGGRGAVREICETMLKVKGVWEDILRRYSYG